MPTTQWKKADYKTNRSGETLVEAERREWYRVSEGLTVGSRVTLEGEILHISELDTEDELGQKVESFRPLTLTQQERSFGRIMYAPYDPSEDELLALGWQQDTVIADDAASQEAVDEAHSEDFAKDIEYMSPRQLREEALTRFGLTLGPDIPPKRMRAILMRHYEDEEADKDVVTEQMKANVEQRLPTREAMKAAEEVHSLVEEQEDDEAPVRRKKKKSKRPQAEGTPTEEEDDA